MIQMFSPNRPMGVSNGGNQGDRYKLLWHRDMLQLMTRWASGCLHVWALRAHSTCSSVSDPSKLWSSLPSLWVVEQIGLKWTSVQMEGRLDITQGMPLGLSAWGGICCTQARRARWLSLLMSRSGSCTSEKELIRQVSPLIGMDWCMDTSASAVGIGSERGR